MMECAGSGRAHLAPRPVSAPWHDEAIGCAEWTGTPLRGVLEDAGLLDDAVELLSPPATAASTRASSRTTSAASRSRRR